MDGERVRVVVVGAGIAGLTAAHLLQTAGADVCVFEASDRVGGRMSTDRIDGFTIDRGAQFLSSAYSILNGLIGAVGLASDWAPASPWAGIVRGGKVRRVCTRRPWTAVSSGLIGWRSALALAGAGLFDWRKSLSDYSHWRQFDDVSATAWARAAVGDEALEYVLEPMLQGFYFFAPEDASAAWARAVLAYGARGARVGALARGMGSLPETLARGLSVRLGEAVAYIEATGEGAKIVSDTGVAEADFVICAAPAAATRNLMAQWSETERRLLATRYSSTVNVAIATRGAPRTTRTPADVYGILAPRRERGVIAAIGVESRKCGSYAPHGELLNVMLDGAAGARLARAADDQIMSAILPELERYFPGVSADIAFTHFYRWLAAEPFAQVGRSRDIHSYRRAAAASRPRLLLAGDYMSAPTTEGAAESGAWAARTILSWTGPGGSR